MTPLGMAVRSTQAEPQMSAPGRGHTAAAASHSHVAAQHRARTQLAPRGSKDDSKAGPAPDGGGCRCERRSRRRQFVRLGCPIAMELMRALILSAESDISTPTGRRYGCFPPPPPPPPPRPRKGSTVSTCCCPPTLSCSQSSTDTWPCRYLLTHTPFCPDRPAEHVSRGCPSTPLPVVVPLPQEWMPRRHVIQACRSVALTPLAAACLVQLPEAIATLPGSRSKGRRTRAPAARYPTSASAPGVESSEKELAAQSRTAPGS